MVYIPLIKETKWVDLSDEHKRLREIVEGDLRKGCCEKGNIQPIMLQGAFGIGKSTTLYYLFHYGWEVLKTPTFYMPLAKIVERVKTEAIKSATGKVENNELSTIIYSMIKSQLDLLKSENWDNVLNLDFPEFKGSDDSVDISLNDYLDGFKAVVLESDNSEDSEIGKTVFSEEIIRSALSTNNTPLLLVDEFESKFYELKRIVESSGGGFLRELFDQIVQSRPFQLVIGNGPASGYEVAKEKGTDGNNDSETAANRRLKTLQIPFPTVNLLKRKFMQGCPNGYVNFIWWMSRCRPGHIQKLQERIEYDTFKEYNSTEFLNNGIFNEPIDESGEEVKYLKISYFSKMNSYLRPIVGKLLLDFEPQSIKIEDSYKDAMKESAEDFYCSDELIDVEKELNPALNDDFVAYLDKCKEQGKYISVDYIRNLAKYFDYILYACANKDGKIAFSISSACRNKKEKSLAISFIIPLLELTYDFISQYEDPDDTVTKDTKDFVLDCIEYIRHSVEEESIDDDFENLNALYDTCKMKGASKLFMQYSLRAIREFIEQPIGSPKLKYKEMGLEKKMETVNFRQSVLLTNGDSDNMVIFIPVLEGQQLDDYIMRVKEFINSKKDELHNNAKKTLRFLILQKDVKIDILKNEICNDSAGEVLPIVRLKKLVFDYYDNYQFNFGGQIADFIDSVAKILITGGSCGDITCYEENSTLDFKSVVDTIKSRDWTKQKEVIRTIDHFSRLVTEGDSCVLKSISKSIEDDYNNALTDMICPKSDYDDNICWDFTRVDSASVTDNLSKYIGMLYIVENAKINSEVNPSLIRILQMVGTNSNSLYLSSNEDNIIKSLYFDQIRRILTNDNVNKILSEYDNEDYFARKITAFVKLMKNECSDTKLSVFFDFVKNNLSEHWINSYNTKMSYGSIKGQLFIQLQYLLAYAGDMDFSSMRTQLNSMIEENEKALVEARTDVASSIESMTELLYSKFYAKNNPDKMPFYGYVNELQKLSQLLSLCKRVINEDASSISVFSIIYSVVSRVSSIKDNVRSVRNQFSNILVSLNSKKSQIEKDYQIPINSIYENELTAKLISYCEPKTASQIPPYNGEWCWTQFARHLTRTQEVQTVIDAVLVPAKETKIDENDIQKFKNILQTTLTNSSYKTRMDEVVATCKACQSESEQYSEIFNYIDELLKIEEK